MLEVLQFTRRQALTLRIKFRKDELKQPISTKVIKLSMNLVSSIDWSVM